MIRVVVRLMLNAVSLGALLLLLSVPSTVRADVPINCNQGDGFYWGSDPMYRTFTCQEPMPAHQVTCQIGTQNCSWTCVNQSPTDVYCSQDFCHGPYGNVTCCDGSCRF
jgi:hypothetical protein